MIACIYIPDIVSVVENHSGMGKQIILINQASHVQAASLGAVQRGVRIGMRLRQAHALCADAAVCLFNETPYLEMVEATEEALRNYTMRLERVSGFWQTEKRKSKDINVKHPSALIYYLDLGKLSGSDAYTLAKDIHDSLKKGFSVSSCIGLSSGKFPASVAARVAKPEYPNRIPSGGEAEFLASFPVTLLPLDKETSRRLPLLGIQTLGQFAALPVAAALSQFGKYGRFLHQLAQGIDHRSIAYKPPKPTERVGYYFDSGMEDKERLETLLKRIGCELGERVSQTWLTAQSLTLVVYLADGKTTKTSYTMRESIGNGKLIARHLVRLFSQLTVACEIVGLEVIASELTPVRWQQLDLFASTPPMLNRLSDLRDNLVMRFGTDNLCRISTADDDDWLLERRYFIDTVDAA